MCYVMDSLCVCYSVDSMRTWNKDVKLERGSENQASIENEIVSQMISE